MVFLPLGQEESELEGYLEEEVGVGIAELEVGGVGCGEEEDADAVEAVITDVFVLFWIDCELLMK